MRTKNIPVISPIPKPSHRPPSSSMADPKPTHIAMLCSPGIGHLIPFSDLAKHLALHHNLTITLITTQPITYIPDSQQTILHSLPINVNLVSFPPPPNHSLPESAKAESLTMLGVSHNLPRLRELLRSLTSSDNPPVALFVDHLAVDAFDVAVEFNLHPYIFFTTNCMALCFALHLPQLDAVMTGEFRDIQEPLRVPGCPPIHAKDLPDVVLDRGNIAYVGFLRILRRFVEAKGFIVNSFDELEPEAMKALRDDEDRPHVYTVGPRVRTRSTELVDRAECLRWLDEQPIGSVLYVSFGSGGTFTGEQLQELALGLEMSKQRFLWVVKRPNENKPNAAYFGDQAAESSLDFLPDGFLERTKGLGLTVSGWAPQVEVVSHGSVAGFMSHCGWNSTLESVVQGVPMVAWPMYAEQNLNALILVDGLKVALRPQVGDDGLVTRDEVCRVIKCLMEGVEGKGLRNRMKELSVAATKALAEGGSSFNSISKLALELKNL